MKQKIAPINIDTLVEDINMEEYKEQLKSILLKDDFRISLKKGVDNMNLVEHTIVPRFRDIEEVDNFQEILKDTVSELLQSEKYVFSITIEAMQDGYNIKIGISPK
jgi:hypothetical protein